MATSALDSLQLRNELAGASSSYLRAHASNPVAWQEWSPKSLELAKRYRRLIFLSIGYNACHWCHVMERESFSSPEVAKLLNDNFIPIKLDRESRPDLDDIYMEYVSATTGHGGWPLNVFLTPERHPVFGGTYWPGPLINAAVSTNVNNIGDEKPLNFLDILRKMVELQATAWDRLLRDATANINTLQSFAGEGLHSQSAVQIRGADAVEYDDDSEPLELDLLDDALDHFVRTFDPEFGGFLAAEGSRPKFPLATNLTFLLRIGASITQPSTHTRFGFPNPVPLILGSKSCTQAARMALQTLITMSRSALRDHLGHGFHRYSVTRDWNLPHFEKMLPDNALLLGAYLDGWALGRNPEILGTIYDLVEYFTSPDSPIVRAGGGWFSSEDADSYVKAIHGHDDEKKEGAFYVWSLKRLIVELGERDASIIARHFGVKEDGNIPAENDIHDELLHQNTLHIVATPSVLAKEFGLREHEVVKIIKESKKKLQNFRISQRGRPAIDDKIVVSYNALAIAALARAANTLSTIDEERATQCLHVAQDAVDFIRTNLFDEVTGKLTRVFSITGAAEEGRAFVDDYAFLIQALIKLYDVTLRRSYLSFATTLQATLDRDFLAGKGGGYYQAAVLAGATGQSEQVLHLKPGTDNAIPSPNGVIAQNLLYLAAYTGSTAPLDEGSLETSHSMLKRAKATLSTFAPEIIQHPFLYVSFLGAVVLDTVGIKSLLIPSSMSDQEIESRGLRGFGRTVVRLPPGSGREDEVIICDKTGVCRPMREGELDELDEGLDFGDDNVAGGAELARQPTREQIEARERVARAEDEERARQKIADKERKSTVVDILPGSEVVTASS